MKYSIIAGLCLCILVTSCKNKDNSTVPPVTTADSGFFYFHLHTNLDTNEAVAGGIYTASDGRKVSVDKARMLISNLILVKADGSKVSIPDAIVPKDIETEIYYMGKVPVGDYKSVTFTVGLDAATNQKQPSADTALQQTDYWFGSAAQPDGYVFINVSGKIDTTTNANGSKQQMQPFMFKVGTATNARTISMPDHSPVYSIIKDKSEFIHITIDYYKLFKGIQLNNTANLKISTPSDNASANAGNVAGNISDMFEYEE